MRFDVYGRFRLEVQRENETWIAYRLAPGKRMRANDLIIPNTLRPEEIATFLDDVFHELAKPGEGVKRIS